MASPFPGMDPYLEQPAFWSSFHSRLIVAIADAIAPDLRPHYYVEVETRSYMDTPDGELLIGIPDAVVLKDSQSNRNSEPFSNKPIPSVSSPTALKRPPLAVTLPMPVEIKERYLEIREVSDDTVITVIEILSPANKRRGKGRDTYEAKRLAVLGSASHLVEIDLLRGDNPLPINSAHDLLDYYVLVSAASQRPKAQLYPFTIRESFPDFLMPLKQVDEAISVDMQQIFQGVCERASYDLRINYSKPIPPPALSEQDQASRSDDLDRQLSLLTQQVQALASSQASSDIRLIAAERDIQAIYDILQAIVKEQSARSQLLDQQIQVLIDEGHRS